MRSAGRLVSSFIALAATLAPAFSRSTPTPPGEDPDHCQGCEGLGGLFDMSSECVFEGETYFVSLEIEIRSGNCVTDILTFECGTQEPCTIESAAGWRLPAGARPRFCISTQDPPWTYCATGAPATGEPQSLEREQPQACDDEPRSYSVSGLSPCGPLIVLTNGLTCTECRH